MIYPLNKNLSVQYNYFNYRHYVIQQISVTYPFNLTKALLTPIEQQLPFTPSPHTHHLILYFYEFDSFLDTSQKWNHGICPPVNGLFHLANVFQVYPCYCN